MWPRVLETPTKGLEEREVNSWVSEKEQRESSNVEEEALNADIFPEEGQGVKEAARADSGEEDEGSGEPDLKKRKSFYDSSLRWTVTV